MDGIDIIISGIEKKNDFIIIYKGNKDDLHEIKTFKDDFVQTLRYFQKRNTEIKYRNEIYIQENIPFSIFSQFIASIQTKTLRLNEYNYLSLYELSSKYEYYELKSEIEKYMQTRPDINQIINDLSQENQDSNSNQDNDDNHSNFLITESKEALLTRNLDICLKNDHFKRLPIQILSRIINSPKRVINDHSLLFDFIKKKNETLKNNPKEKEEIETLIGSLDYLKMSQEEIVELFENKQLFTTIQPKHSCELIENLLSDQADIKSKLSKIEEKIQLIENYHETKFSEIEKKCQLNEKEQYENLSKIENRLQLIETGHQGKISEIEKSVNYSMKIAK